MAEARSHRASYTGRTQSRGGVEDLEQYWYLSPV